MKLKGLIIGGLALVLLSVGAGFFFYEMNKTDEGASATRIEKNESVSQKGQTEKGENGLSESEVGKEKGEDSSQTGASSNAISAQNGEGTVDNINVETGITEENSAAAKAPAPETPASNGDSSAVPPDNGQTGGLYFATREEAIAFGFSRFTQEEIDIYNRASAKGLTPEQQELAIQMAYSRFTAEEIAALEEALNR